MTAARRQISIERTLTQSDFDRFAELSGDNNPIHVDPEFAAATTFGRTVSHGVLLGTILRGLLDRLVPGAAQQSQTLSFWAPTYAEEPMVFAAELTRTEGETLEAHLTCTRVADDTVTCEGVTVLRPAAE